MARLGGDRNPRDVLALEYRDRILATLAARAGRFDLPLARRAQMARGLRPMCLNGTSICLGMCLIRGDFGCRPVLLCVRKLLDSPRSTVHSGLFTRWKSKVQSLQRPHEKLGRNRPV